MIRMPREELVLWAASRVVTEHGVGGRCNRCEREGCPLLVEADELLRRWENEHRQRYPDQAPSWQAVQHAGGRR